MEPGTLIAGYRIERVLGTGGMGTVYLAHDPVLPRMDALKVLGADLSDDPGFRERFIREADTAAALRHPNIVSIYSRGEAEDGQLWIAMQYVEGTDAEAALKAGTINPPRALRIVREIAKALDYANKRGVIHHDVKPSNFLLSSEDDGEDEHVLLSDFGIARAIGQTDWSAEDVSLTLSLAYAAPEVIVGGDVGGGADVYSLGCTLFRLLTGKQAFFQAEGTPGLVAAHLNALPPRISDYLSGTSPQLDAVIAKALAKEPGRRFTSAREFADAATEALRHTLPGGQPTRRIQNRVLGYQAGGPRSPSSPVTTPPPPVPPPAPAQPVAPAQPSETGTRPSGQWPPRPAAGGPPAQPWGPPGLHQGPGGPARGRIAPPLMRTGPRVSPRLLVIGAAVAGVVALLVGLIAVLSRPSSPSAPPPAAEPTTTESSAPPTPDPQARARLAGLLPGGYPPGVCAPAGITSTTPAAELCGPNGDPGGPASATYTLARDKVALKAVLDDVVHTSAMVVCPPNILSPGPWHRTENPDVAVGVVYCGIQGGRPLVAWTNEPQLLVAVARADVAGPPLDQLFTWWGTHS